MKRQINSITRILQCKRFINLAGINTGDEYPDTDGPAHNIPAREESPEEALRHKELIGSLKNISRDEFREAVAELIIDDPDITPRQIAKKLNASINAVQTARRWLRRQLSKVLIPPSSLNGQNIRPTPVKFKSFSR